MSDQAVVLFLILEIIAVLTGLVEVALLVDIWRDGKKMLHHEATIADFEKKVYELYVKYFEKRETEREARNEARRNARAAKKGRLASDSGTEQTDGASTSEPEAGVVS